MPSIASQASELVAEVRAYTQNHEELRGAHHFRFNLPQPQCKLKDVRFVVIGQNPGMSKADSDDKERCNEETSDYDYRAKLQGRNREETKWSKTIADILSTKDDFVQSERFFWSSRRLSDLVDEYKTRLHKSPHLEFCAKMNQRLIEIYDAKLVVCFGFAGIKRMEELHRLNHKLTIHKTRKGVTTNLRLIVRYEAPDQRNWVVIPNPTGSFGFSGEDKQQIKKFISTILAQNVAT